MHENLTARLSQCVDDNLYRTRQALTSRKHSKLKIGEHWYIDFTSNDYLNIAQHAKVKEALIEGVKQYGLGSGSSALISGFYQPHLALEKAFAEFMQREAALLFSSGYHANLAVLTTLLNRHANVISDKLCHASILDGIQLSRARHYRYTHNDMTHLAQVLNSTGKNQLIVSESIFSMEGDLCSAKHITALSKKHHARLMIDDAHGFGTLGQHGRGLCEYFQLTQEDIPYLVTALGKALGSMGAIVSGSKTFIDSLIQFSRSYRYTTAMPPALAQASLASLNVIKQEPWRIEKLHENIRFFHEQAAKYDIPLLSHSPSPIKIILIGNACHALRVSDALKKNGFYIACIRPPTVKMGTSRLRISINTCHTKTQISALLKWINVHVAHG